MSTLNKIKELKEEYHNSYNVDIREKLDNIAVEMEEMIGASAMWHTLQPAFELSEYFENLEYIARENDL